MRRGERLHSDRPALVVLDDDAEEATVHLVEAGGVDLEPLARVLDALVVDASRAEDLGEVADAAEQAVGDARRAARATRDRVGARCGSMVTSSSCALRETIASESSGG